MVQSVQQSIAFFISKLLSFFRCCQSNQNNNGVPIDDNNSNLDDNNCNEVTTEDVSSELVVNAYINRYTSDIDLDNFFCGSIPSSIADICCDYTFFGKSISLQIDDYLNLETNKAMKINEDNNNKYIEYFSSDYKLKNNIIFRNIICIEQNKSNDGNPDHDEYETDYYLQLISLPNNLQNITIDYELSSTALDIEWKNIVTMQVGDIVGAPSCIHNKSYFKRNKHLYHNDIKFVCNANILLKNGRC